MNVGLAYEIKSVPIAVLKNVVAGKPLTKIEN
jgi:hypothetical protein